MKFILKSEYDYTNDWHNIGKKNEKEKHIIWHIVPSPTERKIFRKLLICAVNRDRINENRG